MIPTLPFEQMLRQLQAGVATLEGPDLRYSFVNDQMRELVGEAKPGQRVADQPGQLPSSLLEVLPRIYAAGEQYTVKACACGPQHCYDLSVQPYHDEHGAMAGLLLLAVDVSEQEAARQRAHELALTTRRLDARLRVLTETAPLVTFTTDAQGKVTYVSPQWYRFTGQPPTADLTAIWPLLVHPDDRLRVLYEAEAARRVGAGWNFEYRLRRYDGAYRWMLSRALPEMHPPDAPVFWHGALTEVHQERELSEARRRGEAELRFLADSIPELVWTASAEGLVDYYNQYTLEYTGLTKEELGPTGWVGLLQTEEQAAAARRWVQSVASGTEFEGEYRMRRHDGVYRWHTIRARQLSDGSGPRWFGTCSDVEEQYRLRQVLQTQYDELSRAHHNLDTFVYAASHDLRQPTNNLRGLFEELRRSATFADPEQALMLQMVDAALTQLDDTLIDLATTVRTQRQQQEPVEVLDMALVLEEILLGLRPEIMQRGARIEVLVGDAPGLRYSRANLRSVVHNLVSNALKFSHPVRPPHIVLRSYHTPDDQPVLEVQDNGLGMHIDNPAHPVFQLFARQHTHVDGTGVGLYLVQRIVSSQGGHVTVTSTLGEGTAFRVYWTVPAA
ncbi:PAS domain-containing sensor histidine kinase [Hymenobacter metallilatus]|uniref:histidine kinase n=1 Tax=Hymenobacter metallilatus TaxID=2493666 RepID=A0A3R9NI67_9BACT|nr:PAS domain-containing sensor histidine kinase [Hymenobacter metallilatus]RSK33287.1 PAS domain-containing sensor histidine kinase [Hymenobacter metallilatus]